MQIKLRATLQYTLQLLINALAMKTASKMWAVQISPICAANGMSQDKKLISVSHFAIIIYSKALSFYYTY